MARCGPGSGEERLDLKERTRSGAQKERMDFPSSVGRMEKRNGGLRAEFSLGLGMEFEQPHRKVRSSGKIQLWKASRESYECSRPAVKLSVVRGLCLKAQTMAFESQGAC